LKPSSPNSNRPGQSKNYARKNVPHNYKNKKKPKQTIKNWKTKSRNSRIWTKCSM